MTENRDLIQPNTWTQRSLGIASYVSLENKGVKSPNSEYQQNANFEVHSDYTTNNAKPMNFGLQSLPQQ